MHGKGARVLFLIVVLGGVLIPSAAADEGNKEVFFSVRAPLEVPGRVLKPGRYDLKLQGDGSPVAGLWNASGSRFYGYFDTTLVHRYRAPDNVEIVFTRSAKTAPLKLDEWFYPGGDTGNKLLYPSHSTIQVSTAQAVHNNK